MRRLEYNCCSLTRLKPWRCLYAFNIAEFVGNKYEGSAMTASIHPKRVRVLMIGLWLKILKAENELCVQRELCRSRDLCFLMLCFLIIIM